MKLVYILFIALLLSGCSPKPSSDTTKTTSDTLKTATKDSVKTVKTDPIPATEVRPVETVVAEVKVEKKDPSIIVVRCKFKDLEANPCTIYIFECGKFPSLGAMSLKSHQAALWGKLMAFPANNEGDFPVANPDFIGKTFEITYKKTQGDICSGPNGSFTKGEVLDIIDFKLVDK